MYLGIDLGTSSVKALLIDADQKILASTSSPLEVSRPHPGWSEQAPADWIAAADQAVAALAANKPAEMGAVRGIGLSGQMHGATLLDGSDEVLRPCILWNDTRSHAEAAALDGGEDSAIAASSATPSARCGWWRTPPTSRPRSSFAPGCRR